ncbi:hypothetical protein [Frondihabitans sp. PAMC 28766]|uniref:hypothetical protein n=1 Tax=Frondihabitans sp. PAMC 28766 TaxID=1795630 RepID=UPI0012FF6EFA|nr:hypothetical protein [Frondihabitans sp. PAMC 28766]
MRRLSRAKRNGGFWRLLQQELLDRFDRFLTGSDLFVVNGINNQPGVTKTQIKMTSCNGATSLTGYPSIPDLNGTFTIPWANHGSLEKC